MRYVVVHEVVAKVNLALAPGATKEQAIERMESTAKDMLGNGVTVIKSRVEEHDDDAKGDPSA